MIERKYLILIMICSLLIIPSNAAYTATFRTTNLTDAYIVRTVHNETFANLHNATTGDTTTTGAAGFARIISDNQSGRFYQLYRGALIFNTSSLPDDAVITSVKLGVFKYYREVSLGDFGVSITKFTIDGDISDADFNNFEFVNLSPYQNISSMTTNQWYNWTLNQSGINWINKTGSTGFGTLSQYDIENSPPAWIPDANSQLTYRTAENMTNQEPILEVTYDVIPVFVNTSVNSSTRITHELEPIQVTAVANDTAVSAMSWSSTNLPAGATFIVTPSSDTYLPYYNTQTAVLRWTPSIGQIGSYTINLTANNSFSSNTTQVTITVKKNYLLDPTACSAGSTVIGNGDCVVDEYSSYGASKDSTIDPVGGGYNYSRRVYKENATYIVSNAAELQAALAVPARNATIWVLPNSSINLTGITNIWVRNNVTIASDRGANSVGALIFKNDMNSTYMFNILGNDSRITGLRLQGPDMETRWSQMLYLNALGRYYDIPNSVAMQLRWNNFTLDNCELVGWDEAVVRIYYNSSNNWFHHNYVHGNDREALGYGFGLLKGSANNTIEANIFDWNRHHVATEKDATDSERTRTSYEAKYNVIYGGGVSNKFDAHGGNDVPDKDIPGGYNITVHHNTFYPPDPTIEPNDNRLTGIRGIPLEHALVTNNWAAYYSDGTFNNGSINLFNQSIWSLPAPYNVAYINMTVSQNWINETRPLDTIVANFSAIPVNGTSPLTVNFTDESTNAPTSWSWTYNNGTGWKVFPTNNTAQNPIVKLPAGLYDINLTVTNTVESDSEIKLAYLNITLPVPVAAFSANNTSICAGSTVKFTDNSTNNPDSWYWEFDVSNTSILQNPTFQYNVTGLMNVSLKVNNTGGYDWENKTGYITVSDCSSPSVPLSDFNKQLADKMNSVQGFIVICIYITIGVVVVISISKFIGNNE